MSERLTWMWVLLVALTLSIFLAFLQGAWAEEKDWSKSPNFEWYQKQMPTPETLEEYKIAWNSCCAHGDVCQSCVVFRYTNKPPWQDGYWYKEGEKPWRKLPDHIVETVPWTPTGKPVLFLAPINSGKLKAGDPVCLKVLGGGT